MGAALLEGLAPVDLVAVGAVLQDLVLAGLSTLPVADTTADITGIHTTAIATTGTRIGTAGMAIRLFTQGGDGPTDRTRTTTAMAARTTRVRLFDWT